MFRWLITGLFMMKKYIFSGVMFLIFIAITSCSSTNMTSLIPQAVSTVKAVSFEELNLTNKDYVILDRVEASARIEMTITNYFYSVKDPEGSFELDFTRDPNTKEWVLNDFEGVVRAGFLSSGNLSRIDPNAPDEIAHAMAMYRIINLVKEQGADGIIEPMFSTNIEQTSSHRGRITLTYLTTVSGKAVRLKTSK